MTTTIKAAQRLKLVATSVEASARTKKFAEQVARAMGGSPAQVKEDDVGYSFILKTGWNMVGQDVTDLAKLIGQNSMVQVWSKGTAEGLKVMIRDKRDY